jgi:SecD/SecF fusion protein
VATLAGSSKETIAFKQAFEAAKAETNAEGDFIAAFIKHFNAQENAPKVATLFSTGVLSEKISMQSSDEDVVAALRAEVKAALDNSFNVLRSRIDRFGVVQPNMQSVEGSKPRILIELPGVTDKDRVTNLLKRSSNLQFWETYSAQEIYGQVFPVLSELQDALVAEGSAPLFPALGLQQGSNAVVGYAHAKDTAIVNNALARAFADQSFLKEEIRFAWSVSPVKGQDSVYELYALKASVNGSAAMEGNVIEDAKAEFTQMGGQPCVTMKMTTEAGRQWAQLTAANRGNSIAIVLDGCVYSAPNVKDEITGGRSEITGDFTIEETQDLANVLRSGKLSAPMNIVDSYVVGPTLGEQSINQGLVSFVVAFVLLMVYMCAMYGFIPGSVANMALLLNLFFTFGILASFQAALTMSGIAGIVLTLGMAVDANVLIYERAKEELASGKNVRLALSDGYKNAFSAIFDSNFTSIITGVILFYFGTGPIKGFATTLIIGLLCSFFTAVFVTRVIYEYFMSRDKWLGLTFTTPLSRNLMRSTKYNFMKSSKGTAVVFAILAVVMVGSFVFRGMQQSIDFTGGRNFVVQFEKEVEPEDVRALLKEKITEDNVQAIALGTDGKTIRVSTNYMINDTAGTADRQIEEFLYAAFTEGGLIDPASVSLATFRDIENRAGGSIISSQKVGPSIASDIRDSAIISVILALIAIFLYILVRFRNVAYSIGSIVALSFDVLMIMGCYSLLYGILPMSLEVDQTFIGAILTAIGYSINDKVVVFDRVREFTGLYPKRPKNELFNTSLNTTLARTVNTSVSTLIVLLCIFVLGGDSIRSFSFAMILGVVFGTISSLFIAAPVAYAFLRKK